MKIKTMTMPKETKNFFEEEGAKIKLLESIAKAMYREKIVAGKDGGVMVKLSTAELRDLVIIEARLMSLKRMRLGLPSIK